MIVGITGKAGAGKDTLADFLVQKHGFVKVALADPLKRICQDLFDFTDEQLWGPSAARNAPDRRFPLTDRGRAFNATTSKLPDGKWLVCAQFEFGKTIGEHFLTTRYALQKIGTEGARASYENVWIDYALRVAGQISLGGIYSRQRGVRHPILCRGDGPHVVIPDVRFENELRAIRAAGGHVVRVVRAGAGLDGGAGAHRSELEQDGFPEDLISLTLQNEEGEPQIMGDAIGHWLASVSVGGYR